MVSATALINTRSDLNKFQSTVPLEFKWKLDFPSRRFESCPNCKKHFMIDKQKIEENIEIAKMLGLKNDGDIYITFPISKNEISTHKNFLKFDADWNWLMFAVDFIESLGFGYVAVENNKCEIIINNLERKKFNFNDRFIGNNKKESVFLGVVDFAKKYNKYLDKQKNKS